MTRRTRDDWSAPLMRRVLHSFLGYSDWHRMVKVPPSLASRSPLLWLFLLPKLLLAHHIRRISAVACGLSCALHVACMLLQSPLLRPHQSQPVTLCTGRCGRQEASAAHGGPSSQAAGLPEAAQAACALGQVGAGIPSGQRSEDGVPRV